MDLNVLSPKRGVCQSVCAGFGSTNAVARQRGEMGRAMDSMAGSTQEMTSKIVGIHDAASETSKAAEGVAQEAQGVSEAAAELKKLVALFTLETREALETPGNGRERLPAVRG